MSDFHDLVSAVERDGDDAPMDRALLLWFLRHVMQIGDFDEYEAVFDSPDREIDGLLVETSSEQELPTLHVFEAKATRSGPTELGVDDVRAFARRLEALNDFGLEGA